MALFGIFGGKRGKTEATRIPPAEQPAKVNDIQQRHFSGADAPEKVFIEKDGPGWHYTMDPFWVNDVMYGGHGHQNMLTLFYCLPEIASAVHAIASRVADAQWELKYTKSDEVDWNNQDFNRLFSQPNPMMDIRRFVYQACAYYLLTGKQYFQPNSGVLPVRLDTTVNWWNLPVNETTLHLRKGVDKYTITSLEDLIEKYTLPQNGQTRVFPADRVFPVINFSLLKGNDPNCPVSIFKGAEKAIANLIAVYEARNVIYLSRGPLGLLVNKKEDTSGTDALLPHEKEEINKELTKSYGVKHGKSTIAVLPIPLDFVQVGANIKDMMPFEETEADAIVLYTVAGIPRHLCPTKSASTFANGDTDMKDFYSGGVIPLAKMLAQVWTYMFKLEVDKDIRNRRYICPNYSHVPFLQEDDSKRADTDQKNGIVYSTRFFSGVCTLNDWIVATGEKKKADPIYNKTLLDMDTTELDRIRAILTLKSPITNGNSGNTQTEGGANAKGGAATVTAN